MEEQYEWWCKDCGAEGSVGVYPTESNDNLAEKIENDHKRISPACANKGERYGIMVCGSRISEIRKEIIRKYGEEDTPCDCVKIK